LAPWIFITCNKYEMIFENFPHFKYFAHSFEIFYLNFEVNTSKIDEILVITLLK